MNTWWTKCIAALAVTAGLPLVSLAVADDPGANVQVAVTNGDGPNVGVVVVASAEADATADANSNGKRCVAVIRRSARAVDENRGWLGVALTDLKGTTAQQQNVPADSVMVLNVVKDSPADVAGLREGDIITQVNGEPIEGVRQLSSRIADFGPGSNIELTVVRDGETITVSAVLEKPDNSAIIWKVEPDLRISEGLNSKLFKMLPDGNFKCEGLDQLKDLPDALAEALSQKMWTNLNFDDGVRHLELKVTRDDTTIHISQEGDGPITVSRENTDGSDLVEKEYATADELEAGDPEAYEIYSKVPNSNQFSWQMQGSDALKNLPSWFDKDFGAQIELRIEEVQKRAEELADQLDELKDKNFDIDIPPYAHLSFGKAAQTFRVEPDGQIEVTVRKGDTEVVTVYSDEADLQNRDPQAYEKYLDVVEPQQQE